MKKNITLSTLLVIFMAATLHAQGPAVTITQQEVTTTSYTYSFAPNNECLHYYVLAAQPGELESWMPMYQCTLERLVKEWGLDYPTDTTYSWIEQMPNTTYVIYALAYSATDSILYSDTLRTNSLGGLGTSVMTVSVDSVTATSVITTATPNDQTAAFKDIVITKHLYDSIPADTLSQWMKEDPYTFYETHVWQWISLDAATEYYYCAIGMNADSLWGDIAKVAFTTLGTSSIPISTASTISIYPNPATEKIYVKGLTAGNTLRLIDLQGRTLLNDTATTNTCTIPLLGVAEGVYILQILSQRGTIPESHNIIIQ